jgi:hypothetical protein
MPELCSGRPAASPGFTTVWRSVVCLESARLSHSERGFSQSELVASWGRELYMLMESTT